LTLQETEEDSEVAPQATDSGQFAFSAETPTHGFEF